MAYHVYVSNSGSEFISHFIMDEKSGKLTLEPDIEMRGSPGAVATNSQGTLMYISLRPDGTVGSFSVDKDSGTLNR